MAKTPDALATGSLGQLVQLGKVAGVPGIALGVYALLCLGLIGSGAVPEAWRGPMYAILAVGAVVLGVVALWFWNGGRAGPQIAGTIGDNSGARNTDKTKGAGGRQVAWTQGNNAPAVNERG